MQKYHQSVWMAIDNIAHDNHISCSRLAIISKLDATSFNKSKRFDRNGKAHFPALSSILKVMRAMNLTWTEFGKYMQGAKDKEEER